DRTANTLTRIVPEFDSNLRVVSIHRFEKAYCRVLHEVSPFQDGIADPDVNTPRHSSCPWSMPMHQAIPRSRISVLHPTAPQSTFVSVHAAGPSSLNVVAGQKCLGYHRPTIDQQKEEDFQWQADRGRREHDHPKGHQNRRYHEIDEQKGQENHETDLECGPQLTQ